MNVKGQLNLRYTFYRLRTLSEFGKLGLCSWRTLPVPPTMQLMQSSHASSLHSTRAILGRTTCAADDAASPIFERRAFTRLVCFWRALPVPSMMHLVQSPLASSLYSTRMFLVHNTCAANAAACTIFSRLEPVLDPCASGAHYVCHRCCNLCSLPTPRAFTRPGFFWRALPVPPMLRLVQF